jgi:hypothetical protein
MVAIAPQDTAIATAVGLNGGTLVGAAVAARRLGQPLQEGVTDSAGVVKFQGLVTGPWVVSVVRPLTAEERTVLPPGAEDVTGFAGGAAVTVDAGGTRAPILASAGRGGSVTISELFAANPSTDGNSYNTGQYLELVNNSFETVYLDGMIVGFPYILVIESNVWSCDQGAPFREDSLGLWTRYFATIPGGGTTYPLAPGGTVVIATDAIDHSVFVPGLPNLSGASFEFIGSADVNNPAVPDMLSTGLAEWLPSVGHGLKFLSTFIQVFVAKPLSIDTLPRAEAIPGQDHVRIPRDAVLDVYTSRATPELQTTLTSVPCARMVHPIFDLQSAELYDYRQLSSMRRQVFLALGDGRVLLRRTGNSRVDFESSPPTPGRLP